MSSDALTFISDICGTLKTLKRTGWVKHQIPVPESDSDHMHRCAMCALLVSQPTDPRDDYSSADAQQYHPSKVDTAKLLRMAVTHDLCEALAGDITPYCDPSLVQSKYDMEEQAMRAIQKVVGDPLGEELYQLWKEYESLETVEAVYCKDIDKFEMVVQAYEYEKNHLKPKSAPTELCEHQKETASKKPKGDLNHDMNNSQQHHPSQKDERVNVFSEPLRGFFISTNTTMTTPLFRRLDAELRERRTKMLQEKGWNVTDDEQQQPLQESES